MSAKVCHGKTLVSSSRDGSGVRWWDVASGTEKPRPWFGHHTWVKAVGFSRDGKDVFSLGAEGLSVLEAG
jgi:hypothetical protein